MFQMTYSVVSGYKQFAIDKSQRALSNKNTNQVDFDAYVQERKKEKPSKNGKQQQDA